MENFKDKLSILVTEIDYLENMYEKVITIIKKSEKQFAEELNNLNDNNIKTTTISKEAEERRKEKEKEKKEEKEKEKEKNKKKVEEENVQKSEENKNTPKKYKKLFRKIVSITHPDKHPKDISDQTKFLYLTIYHELIESFENSKYYKILIYAEKLNIDFDFGEFKDDIFNLFEYKKIIHSKIEGLKSNYLWKYYMIIDEKEKEKFFIDIASKLKKTIKRNNNK